MSHAAKAFESCERAFKPVFADPKPQKSDGIKFDGGGRDLRGDLRGSDGGYGGYSSGGPLTPHLNNHHSPFDAISYSEYWKPFDICKPVKAFFFFLPPRQ